MQSQLIFLIALVAGCTAFTFEEYQTSGQGIPNYWKLTINNTLDVDFDEILDGTVVIYQEKNFVQLKDGRLVEVKLIPIGRNYMVDENVDKDFNVRMNIPLVIGEEMTTYNPKDSTKPVIRAIQLFPSQSFVYISRPGDVHALPCWEFDYGRGVETVYTNDIVYHMIFTVRKASECF